MLMEKTDRAWERYGEVDPYFGVCSHDQYLSENLDAGAYAEFFRSGEEHVDFILRTIRHHVSADFHPGRALDFGCGVGRLVVPLAGVCREVVGVDVSEAMLREARANCERHAVGNAELVRSDDALSRVTGRFDLIHSVIVFQHIPPRRGMAILRQLVGRLAENGVGALHFTYGRNASTARKVVHWTRKHVPLANAAVNLAQGRSLGYPMMQMNNYSLNRIFGVLQETGCGDVYAHLTDHGGHLGAILFFRKLPAGRG